MLQPSLPMFFFLLAINLPALVLGAQTLQTSGFSTCLSRSNITVHNLDLLYNADNMNVTFNVAGTSTKVQNVTAQLNVTAYGIPVYQRSFDPCAGDTFVAQLCPVPSGTFSAIGTQTIPVEYASQIPSIAFSVPDIDARATLELKSLDTGVEVACISSLVSNGKTASAPAVSYIAAGMAGAALVMTGASAAGAAGVSTAGGTTVGTGSVSPSFVEVFSWFQGLAMNGMMSVNYPPVYRAFTKNFAFSAGIIPWTNMQTSIDNFRAATGGNLTDDSVQFLRDNATLVYGNGTKNSISRRAHSVLISSRDSLSKSVDSTATDVESNSTSKIEVAVSGIKAYVEQLSVPEANTFMTVLLVVACVITAIAIGVLLFKLILEVWALFGSLPQSLAGFRKHYWGTMARSIVQLILVFYGIWVLYSIFQFMHGDSWAAKALAALTLTLFTAILAFFIVKISQTAAQLKKIEGDVSGLYEQKHNWMKYSIFYESYKKDFWWLFVPVIAYMFAKGCVLAAADGHGFAQSIAQLVIEILMLGLLIWNRPFERRSGNVINIFIQVVRTLSVVCILVFVEELGISQTTQTVTGVVLIAVQSVLTGVLAILIAVNAIIICCKENPHRKRRKAAEKLSRDLDHLTPLDARNSLLIDPSFQSSHNTYIYGQDRKFSLGKRSEDCSIRELADPYPGSTPLRQLTSNTFRHGDSRERLVEDPSPLGGVAGSSPQKSRLPHLQSDGSAYRGIAY